MTRRLVSVAALAIAAIAGVSTGAAAQKSKRVVVIDAGHGGPKPGMRARLPGGATIDEKTITLGIALKLEAELKKRGVEVVMTRTRDVDVDLNERGRIANAAGGKIFLSIHVNAAGPRQPKALVRGLETYFFDEAKTEDERRVEAMENEIVSFETDSAVRKDDPLDLIMRDMAQNEHLRESLDLALTIQESVGAVHPGPDRGVKQANFAVLRTAFMPSVLIETGFGSNPSEAQWLASSGGQRTLAIQIAEATIEYLEKYELRVRSTSER
jgi:N-acetylmuramoyl-L-alanine amidase